MPHNPTSILTRVLIGLILTAVASCGPRSPNGQRCFKRTKVLISSQSTHKFWDDYFQLRNEGFFNYYTKPFGVVKMGQLKGRYVLKSDTLFLHFCKDSIPGNLTGLGVLDLKKREIVLFSLDTLRNMRFYITADKMAEKEKK